jgi:hypothetical protein
MTIIMRINISVLLVLSTLFACGMEKEKHWNITLYGTKINLTQGNMLATYADGKNKVDLIVVGYHQQETVGCGSICGYPVGECRQGKNIKFIKDNSCGNVSHFSQRGDYNICLKVTEPFIEFEYFLLEKIKCSYNQVVQWDNENYDTVYEDEQAIEEASKDLALCYKNVLNDGLKRLGKREEKSIAIPTLGVEVGCFPREKAALIAVQSIFEFIRNNSDVYNCMELFVQEQCEFELYKLLFKQYQNMVKNSVLFLCAHKDDKHFLSLIPRDVIGYIVRLL